MPITYFKLIRSTQTPTGYGSIAIEPPFFFDHEIHDHSNKIKYQVFVRIGGQTRFRAYEKTINKAAFLGPSVTESDLLDEAERICRVLITALSNGVNLTANATVSIDLDGSDYTFAP